MTSVPDPVRRCAARGAAFAAGAAAAFTVLSVESIVRGGVQTYRDWFWLVPGTLTLAAFAYLHRLHAGRAGRWEQISYWVVQVALGMAMIGNVAVAHEIESLAWLGFPLGALLWMAGLISWGASLLRAGVLPGYAGWALILLEPGSIAAGLALAPMAGLNEHGGFSGAIAKAVALYLVAVALRRAAPAQRPDRDLVTS